MLYNESMYRRCSIGVEEIAVHKGGASNVPNNYRPIAVVSVVAKVLEKIVATKLSAYFTAHHLLHASPWYVTRGCTDGGCRCYHNSARQK